MTRQKNKNIAFLLVLLLGFAALSGCGSDKTPSSNPAPQAPSPESPTVSLTSSAASIELGQHVVLTWSSTGATSCTAAGGWSGAKATSGTQEVGPLLGTATFELVCTGTATSATATVTVEVVSRQEPRAEAQLRADVRVLDGAEASLIVEATDTRLTFNGPVPLQAGEVIVANGSAYKVLAVEQVNGQTLASVSPPTIEELFDKLEIVGSFVANSADVQEALLHEGPVRLQAQALSSLAEVPGGSTIPAVFNVSNPGVEVTGDASLTVEATSDINYDASKGGFQRSSFAIASSLQASASIALKTGASVKGEQRVVQIRIPIPLTVVDSVLRLVGTQLASIYVPVYIGTEITSEFEYGLVARTSASSFARVELSDQGTVTGSYTYTTPTLTLSGLSAGPSADAVPLATANVNTYVYLSPRPSLAVLNTVALIGIDSRIGPSFTSTLQFLPSAQPPYCLRSNAGLRAEARGFISAVGTRKETDPYVATLTTSPTETLGACQAPTTLTIEIPAQPEPTVFVPLQVTVRATGGGGAATGAVRVKLDSAECEALLDAQGVGTCSLIPTRAGNRELSAAYSGSATAGATSRTIPIEIQRAVTSVLLTTDPAVSDAGSLVRFTATVTSIPTGDPAPTGHIAIYDDTGRVICEGDVESGSTYSCTTSLSELGQLTFVAVYGGDDNYLPSTSPDWVHTVVQTVPAEGRGRVSVGYYLQSGDCEELASKLPADRCSRSVSAGSFDLGVSDTVRFSNGSTATVSARSWGGVSLSGSPSNGTYTGSLHAELANERIGLSTASQAGNGWSLTFVVPKTSNYELEIDLSIAKSGALVQCDGTFIAAFQLLENGRVEDAYGVGVSAGGICGRDDWPMADTQTFSGVLPPGTYRLSWRFRAPFRPIPSTGRPAPNSANR